MLMQLHSNGMDSETTYARQIRDAMLENKGRPHWGAVS
jgi:hypothetical protein